MNHQAKDRQQQAKRAKKEAKAKARRLASAPAETPSVRGCQPVSRFSNLHPARVYGHDSVEHLKRDRSLWD